MHETASKATARIDGTGHAVIEVGKSTTILVDQLSAEKILAVALYGMDETITDATGATYHVALRKRGMLFADDANNRVMVSRDDEEQITQTMLRYLS